MKNILLLLFCLLTACATPTNYQAQALKSWQGSNITQLIRVWGVPNQILNIPNGNSYYVYVEQNLQSSPGGYAVGLITTSSPKQASQTSTLLVPNAPNYFLLKCTTSFEVNSQNIIVGAQSKGNYCFTSQAALPNVKNPARPIPTT